MPLKIGTLIPWPTLRTGQVTRLNNLRSFSGDGADGAALESAFEEFQCDNSFKVDGISDVQTQAALKQVHGC